MKSNVQDLNREIIKNAAAVDMANHAGWKKTVKIIPGAVIAPQTTRKDVVAKLYDGRERSCAIFNGGVYDSDGRIVPEAIHIGGSHRNVPDVEPRCAPAAKLEGRWLFGGFLRDHFGHFLVESLVRLWAVDEYALQGVVFINYVAHPRVGDEWTSERIDRRTKEVFRVPFINDMLAKLTDKLPIVCVNTVTRVDELVISTQLSGNVNNRDFIAGHPHYSHFMRSRLKSNQSGKPKRKIYLSRSLLDYKSSKFLLEDEFEKFLAEDGYEIIHPQKMSILNQVAIYSEASKVIAATGSAVHLLALATHDDMEVALLDRNFATPEKFKTQLRGMGAKSVIEIRAVDGLVRPRDEEDIKRLQWFPLNGVYNLDIKSAWRELVGGGFVGERDFSLIDFDSMAENRVAKIIDDHEGTPFIFERRVSPPYRQRNWRKPELADISHIDFIRFGALSSTEVEKRKSAQA